MKIIFPALLCFLCGLLPFVPSSTLTLPAEAETWRDVAISTLSLFIILSVLVSSKLKKSADCFSELRKSEYETNEELAKRLIDRLDSLEGENHVLVEGKNTLHEKVQELLAQIKDLKAESRESLGLKRDAQVDAELVNLLSILQEKGRIIDFFMDDITAYPDAQVGAAARVVHGGCAKVLKDYFHIAPIQKSAEGSEVTLESGYDTMRYRLVGRVAGEPPFKGKLLHHGWIVEKISLPRLLKEGSELEEHRVITAAEVEL